MITLCAIVMPQCITMWALHQRIAAGKIVDKYNEYLTWRLEVQETQEDADILPEQDMNFAETTPRSTEEQFQDGVTHRSEPTAINDEDQDIDGIYELEHSDGYDVEKGDSGREKTKDNRSDASWWGEQKLGEGTESVGGGHRSSMNSGAFKPNHAVPRRLRWWQRIHLPIIPWLNPKPPKVLPEGAWTLTHGFFVQMGGIMITYDGKPLGVVPFPGMMSLLSQGIIDPPNIPENVLKDKSKGDFLNKCYFGLQTLWFIVQFSARRASHLPVAQLEVFTMAFAVLSIINFFLWKEKPLNVELAISVPSNVDAHFFPRLNGQCLEGFRFREVTDDDKDESGSLREAESIRRFLRKTSGNWFRAQFTQLKNRHQSLTSRLLRIPRIIFNGLLRPIDKLIFMDNPIDEGTDIMRVAAFYADVDLKSMGVDLVRSVWVDLAWVATGVLFASLHLISWFTPFPSVVEKRIWQIATLIDTSLPLIFIALSEVLKFLVRSGKTERRWLVICFKFLREKIYHGVIPITYLLSRLCILAVAITSLRQLPSGAFRDIDWGSFWPHM
ncbi:hypothetical protein P691DRAFT_778450 [Macrolepiota fuliginosa MF-IS2]|uniref:Uncharacterized protein n=1 Tax=Macrolepiota fuliginosa MF-IS2 TaxID=1400762 RepID=A0A9P5X458_9AGAR|nr:hypothetical protein P691DRAFT_778450 [Macrolepiota fuliginosa MF-IS2]